MGRLAQIETFTLVVQEGSLAGAARLLGISSPAVSKQLSRLESELGLELLSRSTRSLKLTDVGSNYYQQCLRILEEVEAAQALVSQLTAEPQGRIKIVSGRHFASTYITPHLAAFLKRYPQVSVDLELAERVPDFLSESIDVVIGMSVSAPDSAIQRRITSTRYVYCASPDYLNAFGAPKQPQDLVDHRYITHSQRLPDDLLSFVNGENVRVTPYIRVNDADSMARMAEQGMGIVKLHHYVVAPALASGALVELLADFNDEKVPIYVAYPARRFVSRKVRAFIDFVTEVLRR